MGGVQTDTAVGQRLGQGVAQLPVIGVAHRAQRTIGVDDHRDHRVGAGRRGDLSEAVDVIHEVGGQISAHHRAHPTLLEGYQNQGLLRHEAENGGQCGDQGAWAVNVKRRVVCCHAPTLSTAPVKTGASTTLRAAGCGSNRALWSEYSHSCDTARAHTGRAVMGCGGTVEYLVDDVINTMRA